MKIPGIFYINTMNDSTFAFNFTRNCLQVHEGSLTAVTPFQHWRCMCIDWIDNGSVGMECTLKPHRREGDTVAVWPAYWTKPKSLKLSHWKKTQHVSKLQSSLQKRSHRKTHRLEPWSGDRVSTRFVMERSDGRSPAALCSVRSPHTRNALSWLGPEFPALHKCWWRYLARLLWVRAGFQASSGCSLYNHSTAFYNSQATLSKIDTPFLGVKKTKTKSFKTNSRNQPLLPL